MATQREESKWQFDKTISVNSLFTTIAAVAALVVFGANVNTRLFLLEGAVAVAVKQAAENDARQDRATAELARQTREDYRTINDKLDRLIERRNP